MENRREKRYIYHHRLSITYHHNYSLNIERIFGRGKVIDWSVHGLHVVSSIPLNNDLKYLIRFHVEKSKGLSKSPNFWSREGEVCWIREENNDWHVGIYLYEPLDLLPLKEIEAYISTEDSCYLFLMPEEKNTDSNGFCGVVNSKVGCVSEA